MQTEEDPMVTTVGTSNDPKDLIRNYILLEHDAIAAYDATIDRLDAPDLKAKIAEFREDHLRHLEALREAAAAHGADAPTEGDMKEMLTTGKVKIAGLAGGDGAILKAMATNESDTVTAYENGTRNADAPADLKPMLSAALADEQRHKAWMEETANRL
jgi:rubrerythrin